MALFVDRTRVLVRVSL